MSKKTKIILVTILLSVFFVVMLVIALTRKPVNDPVEEFDPNYAINETREPTEEIEESTEVESININGREITHLERLSPEQYAAKSQLYSLLHNRVALDETDDRIVITEEISEASNEYDVFVSVSFSDGTTQTYVVGYDATSMHAYLRCVTLEEYEYYNSDANYGIGGS